MTSLKDKPDHQKIMIKRERVVEPWSRGAVYANEAPNQFLRDEMGNDIFGYIISN